MTQTFGSEDLRICHLIKQLGFVPDVIFDIGASNGGWTQTIQAVFPESRYELFEPQAEFNEDYKLLLLPFVESQCKVTLHQEIVSDADGAATMQILGLQGVGSSILGVSSASGQTISIPGRKLDTLIETGTVPQPDLIKMDIQGAELLALKGGIRRALPSATVLALELWITRGYGSDNPLLGEVNEFLKDQNFYPFDLGDCYRQSDGVLIAQDVWYCRMGTELSKKIWQYGI